MRADSQPRSDERPYDLRRGKDLDSYLVNVMRKVNALEEAVRVLPIVDPQGHSECPFAEQLYAQKEQADAEVWQEVRRLTEQAAFLEKEVQRLRSTLLTVEADSRRLATRTAREAYREARQTAQGAYNRAVVERNAVVDVLQRAETALRFSRSHKYPGTEGRSSIPGPVALPGAPREIDTYRGTGNRGWVP